MHIGEEQQQGDFAVAIGTNWFHYLCAKQGLDPDITFRQRFQERYQGRIQGPLAPDARRAGGFSEAGLLCLQACIDQNPSPQRNHEMAEKTRHV